MDEALHADDGRPAHSTAEAPLRILISDDHALLRSGLGMVVKHAFPAAEIAEAADLPQTLALLRRNPPLDVILLDLRMPGMNGFEGLRQVRQLAPRTPVAILSAYSDRELISEALREGAKGYIPKASSESVLRHALALLCEGGSYIPPEILNTEEGYPVTARGALAEDSPLRALTPRQLDTLALLVEGCSNKEIARKLGVIESTVKTHVKIILRKLDVSNRTQAAMLASQRGWPLKTGSEG
ncbi:MAG: response regulator transcription factor [Rhodovibrionaceae bacterium]